jgi:hypothetical protein
MKAVPGICRTARAKGTSAGAVHLSCSTGGAPALRPQLPSIARRRNSTSTASRCARHTQGFAVRPSPPMPVPAQFVHSMLQVLVDSPSRCLRPHLHSNRGPRPSKRCMSLYDKCLDTGIPKNLTRYRCGAATGTCRTSGVHGAHRVRCVRAAFCATMLRLFTVGRRNCSKNVT